MVIIGIDPGTITGLAIAVHGKLTFCTSYSIICAMEEVLDIVKTRGQENVIVIVEDARKRKKFSDSEWNKGRYQGVGSIKRDCNIWEEFLSYHDIPAHFKHPTNTKINAKMFKKITGYTKQTNSHSRDAGMLVHGLTEQNAKWLQKLIQSRTSIRGSTSMGARATASIVPKSTKNTLL